MWRGYCRSYCRSITRPYIRPPSTRTHFHSSSRPCSPPLVCRCCWCNRICIRMSRSSCRMRMCLQIRCWESGVYEESKSCAVSCCCSPFYCVLQCYCYCHCHCCVELFVCSASLSSLCMCACGVDHIPFFASLHHSVADKVQNAITRALASHSAGSSLPCNFVRLQIWALHTDFYLKRACDIPSSHRYTRSK